MKAFLLFAQLSLIWSIPVPQSFSHSSDVHHVSVSFGNSQAPQSPVALAHPPYTLQAVHPIKVPAPYHTLSVHSTPLHHQINRQPAVIHHQVGHHPVVHHQVGHHPVTHHQVGHRPVTHHQVGHHPVVHHQQHGGVSLHPVTHDRHLVSRHPLGAAHFYRLAPDHPASRAPAFFSSELLPVKVEELVAGSLDVARGPKQLDETDSDIKESFEGKESDSKNSENEAEKEEAEGTDQLGRTPRLLVIEDLEEEEGSGDDLMLDDILVIEDFEEKSSGDDEEPNIILDDSLTISEEEVSSKVLKNESSGIDPIENESDEGVSQGDVPVSKEEEDVTPLKGIKTILVVTTNPDKIGRPDVKLPENSPEEKVNSEEFLVEEDKDLL